MNNPLKKSILTLAACLLAGGASSAQTPATPAQTQTPAPASVSANAAPESKTLVAVGDPVPPFSVQMFDGTTVEIASLKGKVVLINFWATWCPPCRAELAVVQKEIIDRFAGQNFVFLPISRGETREAVAKFREMAGYDFPMGLDPDRKIYSLFATSTIPRNFIVNKQGTIEACETGYSPEGLRELIATIETALTQQ